MPLADLPRSREAHTRRLPPGAVAHAFAADRIGGMAMMLAIGVFHGAHLVEAGHRDRALQMLAGKGHAQSAERGAEGTLRIRHHRLVAQQRLRVRLVGAIETDPIRQLTQDESVDVDVFRGLFGESDRVVPMAEQGIERVALDEQDIAELVPERLPALMRHQQERKAGKVDIGRLDEALAQQAEREGVVRIDPIGIGAALAAGGNCYVSPPPYTLCGASAGYSTIAFRLRPGSGAVTLLRTWDSDHDGTLRLYEVPSAASAEFDKLDVDHEGSLSPQELGGR